MELSLNPDIGTRDGSLAKDSLCTNLIAGQGRPGLDSGIWVGVEPSADGIGMGTFNFAGLEFKLVSQVMYFNSLSILIGQPASGTPTPSLDLTPQLSNGNYLPCDFLHYYLLAVGKILVVAKNASLIVIDQSSQAVSQPLALALTSGIALLDGTLYVMDSNGNIRGSNLGDITTWNALNTIAVDLIGADDSAQKLVKYLNYVVAFTAFSVQFFYDNANPVPGSPLSAAISMQIPVGTANGYTVAQFSGGLIFVSLTLEGTLGIHAILGTTLHKVSSNAVDKFLAAHYSSVAMLGETNLVTHAYGAVTTMNGREVYLLHVHGVATLVYDIVGKVWGTLTVVTSSTTVGGVPEYFESPYDYIFTTSNPGKPSAQSLSTGRTAYLSAHYTATDSALGQPIVMRSVTAPLFDPTTNMRLRIGATEVIGDKAAEVAYLSYTDDDYQTWSPWEQVSLSSTRSRVLRQGSTHRRSYRMQYSGQSHPRFVKLVLDVPERGRP